MSINGNEKLRVKMHETYVLVLSIMLYNIFDKNECFWYRLHPTDSNSSLILLTYQCSLK